MRILNQETTRQLQRLLPKVPPVSAAGTGLQQSPPYYSGMFPSPQPTTASATTRSAPPAAQPVTPSGSNHGLQSTIYPEMSMLPAISPLQSTDAANLPDFTQFQATPSLPLPTPAISQPPATPVQQQMQGSISLSASVGPGTATVPLWRICVIYWTSNLRVHSSKTLDHPTAALPATPHLHQKLHVYQALTQPCFPAEHQ